MKPWHSLFELMDMYGVDHSRGGGALFVEMVIGGRAVRAFGFSVRDVAAGMRKELAWSPLVFASCMKRSLWQLFEATPEEWQELGIEPAANVYDLAEHIIDALPITPIDAEAELQRREIERRLSALGITPRRYSKPR